ncbi:MAG TPA: NAD(P)-dependent oxidoreductase [Phenylobacterium sp.]|uniref:NAD(P)-dependent oxidoreductase n=1 Tax=Phenylobacterium sp. TaxID=1871053 RepID=UPI002B4A45C1|nr:NAD(P)-dependent oxidoreductase [Phenylobacterium sp.]HKR87461.1 NAD(P)-dependent oxidoreductase [Phenylobacterium sp.]HKT54018.1 NAD(P)-dependent oxidoreductase [Caulobacteraceae bacterium]
MTDPSSPYVLIDRALGFIKKYIDKYHLVDWTPETLEKIVREYPDVRAIVTSGGRPLPELIETLPNLGLVAVMGAGYEGLQTDRLLARGIAVTHAPGANAEDVADHAMALFLGLVRRVADGDRRVRAGLWLDPGSIMSMPSIRNLRVGIVGMGAIGKLLARRLTAFGCQVRWFGPRPKPDVKYPWVASVLELAQESDVLFLAHRADESNRGLVDMRVLEALGPEGLLVNVSRGSAVDEEALIAALRTGAIGGAATDVYGQEPVRDTRWADVPNSLLSPHIGGIGRGSWENIGAMVLDNLNRFYAGQPLATPIPGS